MFASFSRIRIIRSNLRRRKIGIRKDSAGIVIATSLPSLINTPIVPYSIAVCTVRTMFLKYGNEQKVRGEIRDFINLIPCLPLGASKIALEDFIQNLFPKLVMYLKGINIIQHIELHAAISSRDIKQEKMFIENSHAVVDNKKIYPICIAVNDEGNKTAIDMKTWVRAAADLIRRQIPFDDTLRIIHKCSLSSNLLPILIDAEKFNEFLRIVESDKGRQEVQEVIKSMNVLVQSHRRNQFRNHATRLNDMVLSTQIQIKENTKEPFWGVLKSSKVNNDALLESIFKTIYTHSTFTSEEIVRMNKLEFDKRNIDQRVLDTVNVHNILQTIH